MFTVDYRDQKQKTTKPTISKQKTKNTKQKQKHKTQIEKQNEHKKTCIAKINTNLKEIPSLPYNTHRNALNTQEQHK